MTRTHGYTLHSSYCRTHPIEFRLKWFFSIFANVTRRVLNFIVVCSAKVIDIAFFFRDWNNPIIFSFLELIKASSAYLTFHTEPFFSSIKCLSFISTRKSYQSTKSLVASTKTHYERTKKSYLFAAMVCGVWVLYYYFFDFQIKLNENRNEYLPKLLAVHFISKIKQVKKNDSAIQWNEKEMKHEQ